MMFPSTRKRTIPVWASFLLGLLSFVIIPTLAQTCPQIVERALTSVGENCTGLERNSTCYGYSRVNATFAEEVAEDFFSKEGDMSALSTINTITTQPYNPVNEEWGVALMSVQANIPDTLPGQSVIFLLMGDSEIENAVEPEDVLETGEAIELVTGTEAGLHSAPLEQSNRITMVPAGSDILADAVNPDGGWLRVVYDDRTGWLNIAAIDDITGVDTLTVIDNTQHTPMQAFYLRTGIGEAGCVEAPNTMLVQGPKRFTVDIDVNGAAVRLGSTVVLRTINGGATLELIVIDGKATLYPDSPNEIEVEEGEHTDICLTEELDLGVDGQANDRTVAPNCRWRTPQEFEDWDDLGSLEELPEDVLVYPIEIPEEQIIRNCAPNPDWLDRYTVLTGDTLGKIAPRYNLTAQQLGIGNCIADFDLITVGQILRVPLIQTVTATPVPPTATATPAPLTVSISDASVQEGTVAQPARAPGTAVVRVTLNQVSSRTVRVDYQTRDGTAVSGEVYDYFPASGTLTFAPGVTSQNIQIQIEQDAVDERNETFTVELSNIRNAAAGDTSATVTIMDDDGATTIFAYDIRVAEGTGGTTSVTLDVCLSIFTERIVRVDYATANGSAVAASDYTSASGTLSFSPGEYCKPLTFTINADAAQEADETFRVNFSNPFNAELSMNLVTITIANDDAGPAISISDANGNENGGAITLNVTLSAASGVPVTVDFATADDTATTADNDYQAGSGTLTFNPGVTAQQITVNPTGDTIYENDEIFFVNLTNPAGATIADNQGVVTITNDDAAPTVSIAPATGDASRAEGNGTGHVRTFNVTLDRASFEAIDVTWMTVDGTATSTPPPADFGSNSGTVTIPAGSTNATITVTIFEDATFEPDEDFSVQLTGVAAGTATIGTGTATSIIVNDD